MYLDKSFEFFPAWLQDETMTFLNCHNQAHKDSNIDKDIVGKTMEMKSHIFDSHGVSDP